MNKPRIELDLNIISDCAAKGMIQEQIASVFDCSVDTLQRRAGAALKKGYALRNGSLQQKQYEVAMSGNPTMLIWLGKQFLGQRDRAEVETKDTSFTLGNLPELDKDESRPN